MSCTTRCTVPCTTPQVSGILVVLICGSKETAVVPVAYMVERWSQWEFLYYAIPMGLFTLLCNGALFYTPAAS